MALLSSSSSHLTISSLFQGLGLILLANFVTKAWRARRYMKRLQKMGLPMPPHNVFLGHLALIAKVQNSLPSDAHGHYLADQIRQRYPDLGPLFYLNLWPFSDPMLVVTDPDVIAQFCAPDHLLPKHPGVKTFMYPITGGYGLNCLDGETWSFWRKLSNPGSSSGHILTLVASIVEETEIFRKHLFQRANRGEIFLFEDHALHLAIDVIGRVALDTKLNTQEGPNPWVSALLGQRRWAAFGLEMGILTLLNPMRSFYVWNNRRIIDKHINNDLNKRYNAMQDISESKTIIDLALKGYKSKSSLIYVGNSYIDAIFRKYALS